MGWQLRPLRELALKDNLRCQERDPCGLVFGSPSHDREFHTKKVRDGIVWSRFAKAG